MNSYASSMMLMRAPSSAIASARVIAGLRLARVLRCARALGVDRPAARLVVLEILPPRDEAEDHRLGDPPFLRPDRKIDVRDDQADEADAGQAVRDVDDARGDVAEGVRVADHQR